MESFGQAFFYSPQLLSFIVSIVVHFYCCVVFHCMIITRYFLFIHQLLEMFSPVLCCCEYDGFDHSCTNHFVNINFVSLGLHLGLEFLGYMVCIFSVLYGYERLVKVIMVFYVPTNNVQELQFSPSSPTFGAQHLKNFALLVPSVRYTLLSDIYVDCSLPYFTSVFKSHFLSAVLLFHHI